MIPWVQWTVIHLGPIPIQVWGTLVALGFFFGALASAKMARSRGLQEKHIYDLAAWIVLTSMIFARLFHVVFYDPSFYLAHPAEIIAFWQGGLSMFGGFAGALIAAIIYFKRHKLDLHAHADTAIFGLPLGIFIGRIGCFLIHDHPGTLTHFIGGVRYPDGTRHDLGLYESISGLLLFVVFLLMAKKKVMQGWYLIVFCFYYGISRFLMDFLRVVDVRYAGLTPGQYLSIVLVGIGVILLRKQWRFGCGVGKKCVQKSEIDLQPDPHQLSAWRGILLR